MPRANRAEGLEVKLLYLLLPPLDHNAFGDKRHLVVGKVAKNHWRNTRDLVTTFTKTV